MKKVAASLVLALSASAHADEWSDADLATRRLAPSEVQALPAPVRADLERRGCRIPQAFAAKNAGNFARGTFLGSDADDWAVLCSIARASRILVYPGGTAQGVQEVPGSARKDADFLQQVGGGRIGFSRSVIAIGPTQAHRRQNQARGRIVVRFQHAGIEDAFLEKRSRVHYFNGRKWVEVQAGD
ncbi:hypothetical protein H8N03_09530 [Ramlibacter sp. USB13]|uniref:Uncharacterized protein n=1 Tax=Ramlibacter cellulosilyticus TaxID=2764187 RepID=A0A923MQX0_9BURK|nr:hypothetical protein [Ramlibacter cellulosilyticus]MBC5783183.1 hypothetical protein [Ramlibacter cellulosilyticus]